MKYLFLFVLCFSSASLALVVVAQKSAEKINFKVEKIDLPPSFDKSIKSGFSNIFVLQLSIYKNGKVHLKEEVTTKIVFDLWEEIYSIKRFGFSENTEKFSAKDDVIAKLSKYTFLRVLSTSEFNEKDILEIDVRVVVDPISKEKQKKIKTWLAENQVNMPSSRDVSGSDSRKSASTGAAFETVKRSVFNQVLESELDSDATGGEWVFESGKIEIKINSIDKESKNAK